MYTENKHTKQENAITSDSEATHSVRRTHYLYNLCHTDRINIHSYTPTHAHIPTHTYTYIYSIHTQTHICIKKV